MPSATHRRVKTSTDRQRVDSVADIKSRWKVSDDEYDAICISLQGTLEGAGILGERIQGRMTQTAVTQAVEKMMQKRRYQSVFKDMDVAEVQSDLRYLAQLLNQNYRRRLVRGKKRQACRAKEESATLAVERSPGSTQRQMADVRGPNTRTMVSERLSSSENEGSCPSEDVKTKVSRRLPQQEPPALTTMMLVIRWQDEAASRIYRTQDLCSERDADVVDGLDSLQYGVFMSILTTDFDFSPDGDVLLYDCVDEGKMVVSNEKIWRAALWDMFNQGQRYFRFKLQRKGTSLVCT